MCCEKVCQMWKISWTVMTIRSHANLWYVVTFLEVTNLILITDCNKLDRNKATRSPEISHQQNLFSKSVGNSIKHEAKFWENTAIRFELECEN